MACQTATIAAGFAILGWIIMAAVNSQIGVSSTIFVRRDVAAVYFLGWIPRATFCLVSLPSRLKARGWIVVAMASLAISLPLLPAAAIPEPSFGDILSTGILRSVVAFGLAITVVSLTTAVRPPVPLPSCQRNPILAGSVCLLVATVVPSIYLQARCRHDALRLEQLLEQSRLGEAQTEVRDLRRLAGLTQWRGRRWESVSRELDRLVHDLESQVSRRPGEADTSELKLLRCRQLAMLGRTSEALRELTPLLDSPVGPAACELCGLIYETTAQWQTACNYHRRARSGLKHQPSTPERDAGLLRAATRLGYCERKLGNFDVAEAEYRDLLARSPTAETHFLLAQFYEDMQQSSKAHAYARVAMSLAPQRYQHEGTKIINKLMVGHFGCLGVFARESSPGATPNPGIAG